VFSPSSGRLVDAFGERRIYITGLLIVAASTAAVAFAQNYWQLLVFRGLGGIGSTMFSVSAMALIVRLAPVDARAKASSTYATAFLVGNIAGPVLGGAMAGWGMRIPFIIYAVRARTPGGDEERTAAGGHDLPPSVEGLRLPIGADLGLRPGLVGDGHSSGDLPAVRHPGPRRRHRCGRAGPDHVRHRQRLGRDRRRTVRRHQRPQT